MSFEERKRPLADCSKCHETKKIYGLGMCAGCYKDHPRAFNVGGQVKVNKIVAGIIAAIDSLLHSKVDAIEQKDRERLKESRTMFWEWNGRIQGYLSLESEEVNAQPSTAPPNEDEERRRAVSPESDPEFSSKTTPSMKSAVKRTLSKEERGKRISDGHRKAKAAKQAAAAPTPHPANEPAYQAHLKAPLDQ